MGCASSKLDDLPAVALCRERCVFLDEAIHQRYALAAAHIAYINSLKAIGHSLHSFVHHDTQRPPPPSPSPPSSSPSPPHKTHQLSKHASPTHSDSGGSHLHFHSDSDDLASLHHSPQSSPIRLPAFYDNSHPPDHHLHINYMKNKAAPSIVYEQRPLSPETGYLGESSSSFYPYPSSYPSYPYTYDPYSAPPFAGSSQPQPQRTPNSKPPPPPPSPPRASTWDFLNFFDNSDDKYYPQPHYTPTPSRDSRELREEEGIPDLEDEDYHHEVVKQVHGDQKLVDPKPEPPNPHHNHLHDEDDDEEEDEDEVEYEVHVVDKKVVDADNDANNKPKDHAAFRSRRPGSRNPLEVAKEIQDLFQRASDSGALIAKILEVGKLPHNRKHAAYQGESSLDYFCSFHFSLFSHTIHISQLLLFQLLPRCYKLFLPPCLLFPPNPLLLKMPNPPLTWILMLI